MPVKQQKGAADVASNITNVNVGATATGSAHRLTARRAAISDKNRSSFRV
jgi:hypothetical protein